LPDRYRDTFCDAAVRVQPRELATLRRRFGYRRPHNLLRREGIVMNHKKPGPQTFKGQQPKLDQHVSMQ
jgi:hypothetical protein